MPKQIRHWMGLVWKKCPVSRDQTSVLLSVDQSEHEYFSIKPSKHCKWIGRFSWSSFSQRFHIIFFFFSLYRVAHLFWNQTALFLGKYFIYLEKMQNNLLKQRLIKFIRYTFWEGRKSLDHLPQSYNLTLLNNVKKPVEDGPIFSSLPRISELVIG